MPKAYRIIFGVDDRSAVAAYRRGVAGFTDVERAALKAATATEAAFARASASVQAAAQSAGPLPAQFQAITAAATAGSRRRTTAAAAEHQTIDVGLSRLQLSGLRLQDQLTLSAERAAATRARLEEGTYARLARFQRRALSDDEVTAAAKNKVVDAANRKRVEGATKAMGAEQESFTAGIASALGLSQAVTGVGAALVAVGAGRAVFGAIYDSFREAQKSAYDAARMVEDYRKSLLELAALKGKLGGTTEALAQDVVFRAKTLQTAEAAREYQTTGIGVGLGAVNAGIISDAELRKALEYGGAFQAAEGGDARAQGKLQGILPFVMGGRGVKAEDVERRRAQLYKIFQASGPEYSQLVPQYTDIAALMGPNTGAYEPMQAAALLSAFGSTKLGSGAAGTALEQFTRATVGGVDRSGKPRILGGEPLGKYYRDLGVTPEFLKKTERTQLPFRIADLIAADLEKAQKTATAKGESFSPQVYLKHKGYGNIEDLEAITLYAEMKRSGVLQGFMDLAKPAALPTFEETRRPVLEAQRTEPALQARKGELAGELAEIRVGAGKEEFIKELSRVAFERLKSRGAVAGKFDESMLNRGDWGLDVRELIPGLDYRHRMDLEAQNLLVAEAKRVGVPVPAPSLMDQITGKTEGPQFMGREKLYELGMRINAAGGTATPGMEELLGGALRQLVEAQRFEGKSVADLQKALEENTRAIRDRDQKLGPPPTPQPVGAQPRAQPIR